jgi:AAA+ superfamily predicted ATPase
MLSELKLLLQTHAPLLALETHDEQRAVDMVRRAASESQRPLFEWSVTTGLLRTLPSTMETGVKGGKANTALEFVLNSATQGEIYLFKDLGPHAKDAYVQRQLRDVIHRRQATVILVDDSPLPDTVRRLAAPLTLPLPDTAELEGVVREVFRDIKSRSLHEVTSSLTKRDLEHLVQTLRGLTTAQAERVVASAILADNALTPDDLSGIVEAKRNLLQSSGCLESITLNIIADDLGGLANLKQWLAKRRAGLSARAKAFGLDAPRGMLLLGVQGCGKSLCAKVVAESWDLPLLRLDPSVLYQKFVGESENRLRMALAQAETMAPVVLWIDEIEKAFASASSDSADGGLSQRMFGTLLSWMQDHRSPIFLVATANNVDALPPELLRKGRFDEVFFVDLPSAEARRHIVAIHLRRRKRDPQHFDLHRLAAAAEGFSGAEIEQAIVAALYTAYANEVEVTEAHIEAELRATHPLSVLMRERVQNLRAWARERCVSAD